MKNMKKSAAALPAGVFRPRTPRQEKPRPPTTEITARNAPGKGGLRRDRAKSVSTHAQALARKGTAPARAAEVASLQ